MSPNIDIGDILWAARDLYAASPSHCEPEDHPVEGTYCPMTAIWGISGVSTRESAEVLNALRSGAGTLALPEWNAENSTETVLAAFDAAIEATS